ncbi:MAG: hypothetical protein K2U26_09620 [Cyclobacteriaceae bacterium]|nr:hypothetical protein [Cyclobacteriaceae bacterium]
MAIPKIIYQTYAHNQLPFITRLFIWWMRQVNPEYRYEFFDDNRIASFLKEAYGPEVFDAYDKLVIGAAKGDFFRYAVLLKTGGVYIDVDGAIVRPLKLIINDSDNAVLTRERDHPFFVQWALIFDKGHPFLERTLKKCIENINQNRFPHSVHQMTGPSVFTEAVNECLAENPNISYRVLGIDYERKVKKVIIPKHFLNAVMYVKKVHWMKDERPVLK